MRPDQGHPWLETAKAGIEGYLNEARTSGRIDEQSYRQALRDTFRHLKTWVEDGRFSEISPLLRTGLEQVAAGKRWEDLVNAFRQTMRFGTGGIRGMMAFDRDSIVKLKREGLGAAIL